MAYQLPNGSTFDVASDYKEVSEVTISNSNPAVVTSTDHGLEDGNIVLFSGLGWTKLNNRAFRIQNSDVNTYELENVDTTDTTKYPTGAGVGNAKAVASWIQIPQVLTVDYSGGEQQFYTFQFLEDDDERQLPTNKSAATLTLNVADDPDQPYVPLLEEYDEVKETQVFKLNLVNGDSIVYPAVPSITTTPTLNVNSLMERSISLAMQGRITRYRKGKK